jgi:hypothetical protein
VLARTGRPHPDASIRDAGVKWAQAVIRRPLLVPLVFTAVFLVTWSILLAAFLRPNAVLVGGVASAVLVGRGMRAQWRSAKQVLACNLIVDGSVSTATMVENSTGKAGNPGTMPIRPTWLDRSDNAAFGSKLWHKFALGFLVLTTIGILAIIVAVG